MATRDKRSYNAEKAYIETGKTLAELSSEMGVPLRTLERWSAKYSWPEARQSWLNGTLVTIASRQEAPPPQKPTAEPKDAPPRSPQTTYQYHGINYRETAKTVIERGMALQAVADERTWPGVVSAIAKWIELDSKRNPVTVDELLEAAERANITMEVLVRYVKERSPAVS